jgi:phosphonate transport system substrate-binding protein
MSRVLAGDVAVAATNDLDLKAMTASGKIPNGAFDIIWKSEPIPASPIAGRSDLPQSLKDAMKEAMLDLNNKPEVLKKMSRGGYAVTNDEEFDVIRLLEQKREEMAEARSE